MNQFTPKVLIEYERTFNRTNIKLQLKKFIGNHTFEDHDYIHSIDSEMGTVKKYDPNSGEIYVVSFEKFILTRTLKIFTKKLKTEIKEAHIILESKQFSKYINTIYQTFDNLYDSELYNKFQILEKPKRIIDIFLKENYNINSEYQYEGNFYFPIKESVKSIHIEKVFNFLNEENYLRYDRYTLDDFKAILFSSQTDRKLKFQEATPIVVYFLDSFSKLFNDMNPQRIENSKRFLTRQGNSIKANNYYQSKRRALKKYNSDVEKINNFFGHLLE